MAIAAHQEQIFYHYILENQIFLNSTKSEFFTNSTIKDLFEIAKEHTLKFKEAPTKEQLIQLIQIKGLGEKYNEDLVNSLYNIKLSLSEYDAQWLETTVGSWIRLRNLDYTMRKAIGYMRTSSPTAENSGEIVEKVRNMLSTETVIDFSFNLGKDFFDPLSHKMTRLSRSSSGYDFIDICTKGGYWKGSLIVLFGMPKSGKSMWLCNLAAKSVLSGYNTAYITLELQEEIVNMRIGANLLNVPLDDYEKFSEDQDMVKKKLNQFKEKSLNPIGNLHVKEFGTSTASANDIEAYLKKTEEILGYKFDVVFIDYLNIMKNWRNPNSENTYLKIKQISEDVRAIGQQNDWAMCTVTQTNKSGWESNDLHITSIAESGGLLHTVDLLFGICTDPEMKARGEYFLKCLANRVAGYENTRKRFTIDWKYARIEEDRNSPIQDMEFFINNVVAGQKLPRGEKNTTATIDTFISQKTSPLEPPIVTDLNLNNISITGNNLF